jgi:hypothetical protein
METPALVTRRQGVLYEYLRVGQEIFKGLIVPGPARDTLVCAQTTARPESGDQSQDAPRGIGAVYRSRSAHACAPSS